MPRDDVNTTGPPGQAHRIGRIRFDVRSPSHDAVLALRTEVEKLAANDLAARLNPVLNQIAGRDAVLELDRIEVDLGVLPAGKELDLGHLAQALTDALQGAVSAGSVDASDNLHRPARPNWRDSAAVRIDAFCAYLHTGDLPQALPDVDLTALTAAIFDTTLSADHLQRIIARLAAHVGAAERFLHVVRPQDVQQVLDAVATRNTTFSADTWNAIAASATRRSAQDRASSSGRANRAHQLHRAARDMVQTQAAVPPSDRSALSQAAGAADKAGDQTPTADSARPLQDAGLVLLGPYLPRLFDRLDMSPKDDPERAAALLWHLAHGAAPVADEPDLLIARLLLNIPTHVPLLALRPPDASDAAEADALLTAAISHWNRLGQTSLDAFRETFLQRPGLVRNGLQGPLITVEPRGVDVLMASVPWSFSTLRLPWCDQPITVDWA